MKRWMRLTSPAWLTGILGLMALALTGCQTTREPNYVVTEIISEPPGAKIEINGNYLGKAPVKTKIRTHGDGVVLHRTVIRAIPTEAGHFVQEKVFEAPQYPFDTRRDQAPHRVYFDMTLEPALGGLGPRSSPRLKKMESSSEEGQDDPQSSPEQSNDSSEQPSSDSGEAPSKP